MYAVNVLPHKEPVALLCIVEGAPRVGASVGRKLRRANRCFVMVAEAPHMVVTGTKLS